MVQETKKRQNKIYSKIVTFFLFLTIAAIFVIIHFTLAKATIKIYSNPEDKNDNILVEVQSEDAEQISPDAILGEILNTEFDLEATVPSTAQTTESKKAGGYVTIYNNYSQAQTLVATTRLLTPDNKLYRLSKRVSVPAGGQVQVWAEADQAGENFVIGPTKFTIPGLWIDLQKYIYAESSDGMKLQAVPQNVVTQESLDAAQEKIKQEATEQGLAVINELLPDNLKISANRLFMEFENIKSSALNEISDETYLKQKVKVYGLIFDEETLYNAAQKKFARELDSAQSLVEFKPDNFFYEIMEINPAENKAVLNVFIDATVNVAAEPREINKEELTGLNREQIEEYLSNLGIDGVEIKFSPFWVRKAPKLADHIIIE